MRALIVNIYLCFSSNRSQNEEEEKKKRMRKRKRRKRNRNITLKPKATKSIIWWNLGTALLITKYTFAKLFYRYFPIKNTFDAWIQFHLLFITLFIICFFYLLLLIVQNVYSNTKVAAYYDRFWTVTFR